MKYKNYQPNDLHVSTKISADLNKRLEQDPQSAIWSTQKYLEQCHFSDSSVCKEECYKEDSINILFCGVVRGLLILGTRSWMK